MASKIVPANIDGTYPKAGQDNSSQGFRDNFSSIKNNFTEAKTEIEDLQTNKANLNASSNFTDNEVIRAKLKDTSETVYAHGNVSGGSVILNHENGHYQTLTITADTTFTITNLPPTGALGRIILDIIVAPTSTGIQRSIMYFHPLQEEIGNMSEEDISKRIKELSRKVAIARRGRNPEMLQNLQMALRTYQDAVRQKRTEEWHKNNKKLRNEPDLGDLVNID